MALKATDFDIPLVEDDIELTADNVTRFDEFVTNGVAASVALAFTIESIEIKYFLKF
jgi:hypothetical protein